MALGSLRQQKSSSSATGALLLIPSVIMWFECVYRSNAVRACIVFHAYLAVVMFFVDRRPPPSTKERPLAGFFAMLSVGVFVYACCRAASTPGEYLGVSLRTLRETLRNFGVTRPYAMIAFSLYFAVVNPILEELFWRRFARRRLAQQDYPKSIIRWSRPADVLAACAYAAYHSVIISMLMPAWFNFGVAFPFLVVFGQTLATVYDKFGIKTAVAVHSALDLSCAIWILDITFGFLDPVFIPHHIHHHGPRLANLY